MSSACDNVTELGGIFNNDQRTGAGKRHFLDRLADLVLEAGYLLLAFLFADALESAKRIAAHALKHGTKLGLEYYNYRDNSDLKDILKNILHRNQIKEFAQYLKQNKRRYAYSKLSRTSVADEDVYVIEKHRNQKYIDKIGHYNPIKQPAEVVIDADKAKDWLSKGVQPTETVRSLLINAGVIEKPTKLSPAKTNPKKKKG